MKILIGNFILSIFLFLYSFNVNADPAGVNNEWSLIKDTIKDSLKDLKSNFELFIEDGSLKLISKNKKVFIFDLGVKNHDVYLVKENSNSFIYIFNSEDKRLYKSSLDDINFKELDWKFNSLMSIIKVCDIEKYYLDFPFIDKITDNSFLTKYNSLDRPDNMKCGYFIGGGRCELAYDQASGEWGSYSMMIVDNNLNYTGDLSSISSIYGEKCEFYDKIRNFSKDVSMDDLVERDGLYYEVYSDDIFTGDVVVGKEQGKVIKGKREGEWLEYYKNGEVKEKSNFKDGKAEGESINYYDNGKLKAKGNFKDGKMDGEIFSYFENGESELVANFKDGKPEGKFLSYYKNGQLKYKSNYKDGKQEGEWLYYYDNGQLQFKSNYKDGKAEGEHLSYYENGQLEKIEIYKDDELIKTVSESDSEVSEAEENYRKRIIKNSKKHQSDKLKKKGLHKYWNHNSNTISPECFPYEWYSGDNFEHIAEHFSIQYNDDFSKNTGKYFGKEILNFEGIPEPWTKGKYKLYIIRNLDTCSYVEDEIYEYGDHVTYTNPNPEMHIDQIKYEIVEDISLKLCQELAPNFDATCVKSSIFTIGRWQGGSRGFAWMTYIYGLFETKNTKKYIIPLKSWFGLSEKEALDFYSQWDDRSKVDLEN